MRGFYSISFQSKHHEGRYGPADVGSASCCHDVYLLPDGSAVQVISVGRKHSGTIYILFIDDSGQPCDAQEWGARQSFIESAENVTDFYSCGGILIEFVTNGKATAVFNVYSATDRLKLQQCDLCRCVDVGTLQATPFDADEGSEACVASKKNDPVDPGAIMQTTARRTLSRWGPVLMVAMSKGAPLTTN